MKEDFVRRFGMGALCLGLYIDPTYRPNMGGWIMKCQNPNCQQKAKYDVLGAKICEEHTPKYMKKPENELEE